MFSSSAASFSFRYRGKTVERDLFHLCAKADDIHQQLCAEIFALTPTCVWSHLIGPFIGEVEIGTTVFEVCCLGPTKSLHLVASGSARFPVY